MELFELEQISVTIQCLSCLKHVPERDKNSVDVAFVSDQMKRQQTESKPDCQL